MVAVTERDDVILVRSYKHGPRTVSLAVPAGYIEQGEEPLAAAKRELQEETGYASEDGSRSGATSSTAITESRPSTSFSHVALASERARIRRSRGDGGRRRPLPRSASRATRRDRAAFVCGRSRDRRTDTALAKLRELTEQDRAEPLGRWGQRDVADVDQ